jgi:D-arabinose 1-dehydrogenase-like Zn-dependent alcohol dehydrogenase
MNIQDVERPILEIDEVLIKVKVCGLCGSDIHFHETDNEGYILFVGHSTFPFIRDLSLKPFTHDSVKI